MKTREPLDLDVDAKFIDPRSYVGDLHGDPLGVPLGSMRVQRMEVVNPPPDDPRRYAPESLLAWFMRHVRRVRPELLEGLAWGIAAFALAAAGGVALALAAGCGR